MENPTETSLIVTELVQHPQFGDWRYITNRLLTLYDRSLELLREKSPSAGKLNDELNRAGSETRYLISTDPIFRRTIDYAVDSLSKDNTENNALLLQADNVCASMLQLVYQPTATLRYTPMQVFGVGTDSNKYIGEPPLHIVCWHHQSTDISLRLADRFYDLFDQELAGDITSGRAIMRPLIPEFHDALKKGGEILQIVSPELARDAFTHVKVLGIVDLPDHIQKGAKKRYDLCQNVSTHRIPGSIFLSPTPLRHPVHAAEAILHEALHKKLSNLVSTMDIFVAGFDSAASPTVHAIWNPDLSWNSNQWSIDRALYAVHFYAHIAVYYLLFGEKWEEIVEKYGDPGDLNYQKAARNALDRARYLYEELSKMQHNALGAAGKSVLEWLGSIINRVDLTPPYRDPRPTLRLDLYDRETREVVALLRSIPENATNHLTHGREGWTIGQTIQHLIHSEIVSTYRILMTLGQSMPPTFSWYETDDWGNSIGNGLTPTQNADIFKCIRQFTSATLRYSARDDEYDRTYKSSGGERTLYDLLEMAVQHANNHLPVLKRAVREWKRRQKK